MNNFIIIIFNSGCGAIDFSEFFEGIAIVMGRPNTEDLKTIFTQIDNNGNGFISVDEMHQGQQRRINQ